MQKLSLLLITASFLFVSCDSNTSSQQQAVCSDPSLRSREVSFTLNGRRYNEANLFPYGSIIFFSSNGVKVSVAYGGFAGDSLGNFSMELSWPQLRSGIYYWGDRTQDSNATGCTLTFDSSTHRYRYRSVSGITNVLVYSHDSLFGTFCGKVKTDAGELVEIADGKFYF